MHFFYIHPDDARWLRRWLRSNLLCVASIVGFLLLVRCQSAEPLEPMNRASAVQVTSGQGAAADQSPGREVARAVDPVGWRRTNQGWEHASSWPPLSRDLGEIIENQESSEPAWMQVVLSLLRSVPPLAYASLQIVAIALIVRIAGNSRRFRSSAV